MPDSAIVAGHLPSLPTFPVSDPLPKDLSAFDAALGRRVRYFRRLRDLSGTDVAAAIGVGPMRIYHLERGQARANTLEIAAIARALGVPLALLLDTSGAIDGGTVDGVDVSADVLTVARILAGMPADVTDSLASVMATFQGEPE